MVCGLSRALPPPVLYARAQANALGLESSRVSYAWASVLGQSTSVGGERGTREDASLCFRCSARGRSVGRAGGRRAADGRGGEISRSRVPNRHRKRGARAHAPPLPPNQEITTSLTPTSSPDPASPQHRPQRAARAHTLAPSVVLHRCSAQSPRPPRPPRSKSLHASETTRGRTSRLSARACSEPRAHASRLSLRLGQSVARGCRPPAPPRRRRVQATERHIPPPLPPPVTRESIG